LSAIVRAQIKLAALLVGISSILFVISAINGFKPGMIVSSVLMVLSPYISVYIIIRKIKNEKQS